MILRHRRGQEMLQDYSRRRFIGGTLSMAGLTVAGSFQGLAKPGLKIEKIEFFPVRYPMVMRFKFFEGPTSGAGRPAVILKITASDGTVGWGESVPIPRWSYETLEASVSALQNYLIPVVKGRDPFDLQGIHAVMNKEIANSFSTGMPITKAGIDIALHDLIGKVCGKNLAELWELETPDDLVLSWTLNPKKLSEIEELMAKGHEHGYQNFNVKVAPDPEFDLEMCRLVKKNAPKTFLWADANGGYDLETALKVAPKMADIGVDVFEQALPANRLTGYQQLKQQGAMPVILDEGCVSPEDLEEFIALGCCDGMAMKPARCGGLVSGKAQLDILKKHNLMFLGSGLTDPDISLAASLILYGAYQLKYPAALNGPQFLGTSVLNTPFEVSKGRIRIPKGPGLGIEVDENKVKELTAKSRKDF
jgi:L-alanine-DL-glutamate epimerase-like enolase superfamily enzyme